MEKPHFNPLTYNASHEPLSRKELARRRIQDSPTNQLTIWKQKHPQEYAEDCQILGITSRRQQTNAMFDRPEAATVNEVELAEALKHFSRERCVSLFKREPSEPGESAKSLSKAEYRQAKLAAQHFDIVPKSGGAAVSFAYETPAQRAEKRAAREAAATAQQAAAKRQGAGLSESGLPPGIIKDEKGQLSLVDAVAFQSWKDAQAAKKSAREVIANAT